MVFNLFSKRLQELIKEKGFLEPTLPQKLGIPEILEGKNVLIISPTGIGKTEACILPLLDKIYRNKDKPIALLYITPLRALNRDLLSRIFWWVDKLDLEISVRHGDTTKKERDEQREEPPHLLITTPETLNAILPGKRMREHLKNVKYVVIDEIHELAESKRGTQLSVLLERLSLISPNFQRIALSATIGSQKKIAEFLGNNVNIINAEEAKLYSILVELPKENSINDSEARVEKIKDLIKSSNSSLIFTNTRETAEILGSRFKLFEKDFPIEVHHGSLSRNVRVKVEQLFKKGELKSIIATSSLELGIDIGSIDLVVQYLSPRRVTKLLQRVGRSGHSIGRVSKGVIISCKEDVFESCVIASKAVKKEIEETKIHENALDILANQIVGLTLDKGELDLDECYKIIKNAYPYRNLSIKSFLSVVEFLEKMKLIYVSDDRKIIRKRKRGWKYYYDNLSTIPDVKKIAVVDISTNEIIGFLDESFIIEYGEIGNTFICGGNAWKIISIEDNKVFVEYVEDAESAIPAWEGELIPVDFKIAQEVGRLRRIISKNVSKEIENVLKDHYMASENAAKEMIRLIREQAKFFVPDEKSIFIEAKDGFIVVHACFGNLVNNTIGKYIASMLALEKGESSQVKIDPYRIILKTFASPEEIKRIILNAKDIEEIITLSLEKTSLFKWNFFQIAKRFGVIGSNATIDDAKLNKLINQLRESPVYKETIRTILFEKMDIEKTKKIIDEIKGRRIKIRVIKDGLSPLAQEGLEIHFFDIIKPKKPYKEIFESFKRRLMKTRIRIVCTNCWNYSIAIEVNDLEEFPTCPKCSSRLIGIWDYKEKDPLELVKKKTLNKNEKKAIERVKRSASLMITYGKKYAIAHAAHGVSVETAARILAKLPKNEEELLKYVFEAEKSFVRTRKYWRLK